MSKQFKYKEMKQAVKDLAAKIKNQRIKFRTKDAWDSNRFRHLHIAYCLLRGTPMDKIESKVREGNEPSEYLINKFTDKYLVEVDSEEAVRDCA